MVVAFKVTPTGVKPMVSTPFSPSITDPTSKSPATNSWSVPVSTKPYSDLVGASVSGVKLTTLITALCREPLSST